MMPRSYVKGWIELICGPMFAGKSDEIIRRLNILKRAGSKIVVFTSAIDKRYGEGVIASHNKITFPAIPIKQINECRKYISDETEVVAFDEIQFLDQKIIRLAEELANEGKEVILAGLTTDFRGVPFPITAELMARAEFVTKLASVCSICGAPGTKTQRLTTGEPSNANEPLVQVGAQESYESRCRRCHTVPGWNW